MWLTLGCSLPAEGVAQPTVSQSHGTAAKRVGMVQWSRQWRNHFCGVAGSGAVKIDLEAWGCK